MINKLNNWFNILTQSKKNIFQKLIPIVFGFWMVFIFVFYVYYNFSSNVFVIFLFLLILALVIILIKINPKFDFGFLFFLKTKCSNISLPKIIFFVYIFQIIIANLIVLSTSQTKKFLLENFLFSEVNIIQKITSIFLFYLLFLLFISSVGRKIINLFKIKIRNFEFLFSIGLGLIPIMFFIFIISILGLFYSPILWVFIILLSILSKKEIIQNLMAVNNFKPSILSKDSFSL